MYSLKSIVILSGTGIIIISFILSLYIRKFQISYLRWFYICPLLAIFSSINSIYGLFFSTYFVGLMFTVQSFIIIFDFLFWYAFFNRIFDNRRGTKGLKILLLTTLVLVAYLIFFSRAGRQNLHVIALTAVSKAIFCLLFFHSLIRNLIYENITREPAFWIATGLFFYTSLSLPFYGLHSYIRIHFSSTVSSNIFSISNMLIIIMHVFFIKAYTCIIHQRKVL